jgi:hypothetical protein
MTRPTSVLRWWPSLTDPHAIRARWFGAGWHYTLEWGHTIEGKPAQDAVMWWDPPVHHTYPGAGTYTLTGRPGLPNSAPITVMVTLRDKLAPDARFELLDDGRTVRAHLEHIDDAVRYRLDWGDGHTTEHTVADLAPEHPYPSGFGRPKITVTDMPARRSAVFTGPLITDDRPVGGVYVEYLRDDDEGNAVFALVGGGYSAGDEVTFYPRRTWDGAVTLTADAQGQVRHTFTHVRSVYPEFEGIWTSYSVRDKRGWRFVPVQPEAMRSGTPQVTYTVSPTNPLDVEISVYPPMLGKHHVHFGDGFDTQVEVTALPLRVSHNYGYKRPDRPITIFLPDGREAERSFGRVDPCKPCYNPHYPGECTVGWNWVGDEHCPGRCGGDTEQFAPLYVDNGGVHPPHVLHKPTNGTAWAYAYGYSGFQPGTYTFTYVSFDVETRRHDVTIARAARFRQVADVEVIRLDGSSSSLTGRFRPVKEWDGGYSGEFTITNTGQPTPWQIEFVLADPAVLREVWPSTAQYQDLGGGRWRIWSDKPVGAQPVVVGARIEPPGKTKQFPDQITARPWSKET